MRFTESMTEVAGMLFQKYIEGKDREFLDGYLLGIVEYDKIEEEQFKILSMFIHTLFNYKPQK